MIFRAFSFVSAILLTILSQSASATTIIGSYNGMNWTASSTIVGVGPTGSGTVVIPPSPTVRLGPGGATTYLPDPGRHSGVVALIMDYGADGRFICSGSLLGNGLSIATAGHCVSDGTAGRPLSTTAYFYDYSSNPDERVPFNANAVAIGISDYKVNQDYTGKVIDQNDIAILTLNDYAPGFAQRYDLFTGGDLTGKQFNVAGYGSRSEVGGSAGESLLPSTGFLREGDNIYDFRLGDPDFDTGTPLGSVWNAILDGDHGVLDYSYVSDFDNGLIQNDTACRVGFDLTGGVKYCDQGLGTREVGIAGGDSGGPGFIDGKLASINSYGLSFGTDYGDVDNDLNSSFGEFSGYVPVFLHENFIRSAMASAAPVPEPSLWSMMIVGFALIGGLLRRRGGALVVRTISYGPALRTHMA